MGWVIGTMRRFGADERGMALILVSVMLPVIIGFALLAIDMSRANSLHYDLQRGADSFAIAGAAELDGRDDAIVRSDRAIANLVDNNYRFSDAGPQQLLTSAGITRRYLRSLPPDDSTAIRVEDVITDEVAGATEAVFVEVSVNPTGFDAIFPASFLTGSASDNSFNVSATAVAGNAGTVVCDMVPVFICNPFPGEDLYEVANSGEFYNKGIKMIMGSTSWGPGNFGFLRPEEAHGYGENELAADLARGSVPECVNSRQVFTQTGNFTEKAKAGFNTRFDLYGPHFGKTGAAWPAAPNIRKGYKFKPKGPNPGTDPCDMIPAEDPANFRQMTTDQTYATGSQIGDGDWDYEGYLAANGFDSADMAGFVDSDGNAYTNANPPPRYDLYIYELQNGLVDDPSLGNEIGTPQCHTSPSTDPNRRLIYAAILDCSDEDVQDELNGASGSPPAIGFASFFLTEAVGDDDIVYAEIVDIDGAKGRGTMENFSREEVQLYR
jgi:Flp pilus assembly protein TadG